MTTPMAWIRANKKSRKGKGRTMMEKRVIPFSPPDISELEINEVAEAMRSGWITTGPRTKELEKRLAEYCHTSKVVCLNSATAAEELNFRVCGMVMHTLMMSMLIIQSFIPCVFFSILVCSSILWFLDVVVVVVEWG